MLYELCHYRRIGSRKCFFLKGYLVYWEICSSSSYRWWNLNCLKERRGNNVSSETVCSLSALIHLLGLLECEGHDLGFVGKVLWCSRRNVGPEPPALAFSCLPLNTDGAKAPASSDGFRAALWCGTSQQIWAEPSRNAPGTLSALFLRERGGCHNEGNVVRGGKALMRPCNHLTETRCSVSCCSGALQTIERHFQFTRGKSEGGRDKVSILYAKCLLNNNVIALTQIK